MQQHLGAERQGEVDFLQDLQGAARAGAVDRVALGRYMQHVLRGSAALAARDPGFTAQLGQLALVPNAGALPGRGCAALLGGQCGALSTGRRFPRP
jgi:hypothetical protein